MGMLLKNLCSKANLHHRNPVLACEERSHHDKNPKTRWNFRFDFFLYPNVGGDETVTGTPK